MKYKEFGDMIHNSALFKFYRRKRSVLINNSGIEKVRDTPSRNPINGGLGLHFNPADADDSETIWQTSFQTSDRDHQWIRVCKFHPSYSSIPYRWSIFHWLFAGGATAGHSDPTSKSTPGPSAPESAVEALAKCTGNHLSLNCIELTRW